MVPRRHGRILACAFVAVAVACGSSRSQLKEVAKDWCETIRASQILPVYPLTEDLLPGDVFLVTTSIPDQEDLYDSKGYLPLDMPKVRLSSVPFADHYGGSRGIGDRTDTPYHWIYPGTAAPGTPSGAELPSRPPGRGASTDPFPTAYWQAPHAFFPSYEFSVSSSTGINAAIPVQSVPVSMAFMRSKEARGTVQLTDAYTYGVSESELRDGLEDWADANRERLEALRSANETVLLRVVCRVYLVGGINVSLSNSEDVDTDVGVGEEVPAPRTPAAQAVPEASGTAASVTELSTLTDLASKGLAGGAVSYSYASSRQVVANEVFRRPLVVGFIGLDYPVLPDGSLGEAVATSDSALGKVPGVARSALAGDEHEQQTRLYRSAIEGQPDAVKDDLYSLAAERLPRGFRSVYERLVGAGDAPHEAFPAAEAEYTAVAGNASERRRIAVALRRAWETYHAH